MKKVKIFVFAAVLVYCLFSAAGIVCAYEPVKDHPIDIALESKIDDDPSTAGMVEAFEWAIKEWDNLLNVNYSALMNKLDKKEQERLRASQREWIKYRDLEFEFNAKYWAAFQGTMYVSFPLSFQSDFVRERALRLGYYLEDLNDR
ncbi:MAG: DUF1311 domain-containing protein [Synergistaceae bacterium]|nr:DUF1311 domain-containing protein [Synergistaceae bacterium]